MSTDESSHASPREVLKIIALYSGAAVVLAVTSMLLVWAVNGGIAVAF